MQEKKLGPYAAQKAKKESLPDLRITWSREQQTYTLWDTECPKDAFAPLPDTVKAFRESKNR